MASEFRCDWSAFNEALKEDKTVKDVASMYREVVVNCPCCQKKIKFKVKL